MQGAEKIVCFCGKYFFSLFFALKHPFSIYIVVAYKGSKNIKTDIISFSIKLVIWKGPTTKRSESYLLLVYPTLLKLFFLLRRSILLSSFVLYDQEGGGGLFWEL